MDYPLSDQEIRNYLLKDGPINIVDYDQLDQVRHVGQLFRPAGYFILLYMSNTSDIGHWIAVIDHGDHIEFFDPVGLCPDRQLTHLGHRNPRLLELLLAANKPVIFNNIPLQDSRLNTCGRWVILRVNTRDVPLLNFQKIMCGNRYFTPDELVVQLVRVNQR